MNITMKVYLIMLAISAISSQACGRESADDLFKKGKAAAKGDTASFAAAEESFKKFVDLYPKDKRCDEALWQLGLISQTRGNAREAIARYETLTVRYPDSEFSHKAQFLIGFIYEETLSDYPHAKEAYQKVIDHYPTSSLAEQARLAIQHLGKKPEEWINFEGAQATKK